MGDGITLYSFTLSAIRRVRQKKMHSRCFNPTRCFFLRGKTTWFPAICWFLPIHWFILVWSMSQFLKKGTIAAMSLQNVTINTYPYGGFLKCGYHQIIHFILGFSIISRSNTPANMLDNWQRTCHSPCPYTCY